MKITYARTTVHDTRAYQDDIRYRSWLTDLNWNSLMQTGCPIDPAIRNARRYHRLYAAGLSPLDALKSIHNC